MYYNFSIIFKVFLNIFMNFCHTNVLYLNIHRYFSLIYFNISVKSSYQYILKIHIFTIDYEING